MFWFTSPTVASTLAVDNLVLLSSKVRELEARSGGHLYPLQPDRRLVADSNPAGVVGHPEAGAGEVDAEAPLRTVCQTVAVSRLSVRD